MGPKPSELAITKARGQGHVLAFSTVTSLAISPTCRTTSSWTYRAAWRSERSAQRLLEEEEAHHRRDSFRMVRVRVLLLSWLCVIPVCRCIDPFFFFSVAAGFSSSSIETPLGSLGSNSDSGRRTAWTITTGEGARSTVSAAASNPRRHPLVAPLPLPSASVASGLPRHVRGASIGASSDFDDRSSIGGTQKNFSVLPSARFSATTETAIFDAERVLSARETCSLHLRIHARILPSQLLDAYLPWEHAKARKSSLWFLKPPLPQPQRMPLSSFPRFLGTS